jgi:hypothetical protein
LPTKKVEKPVAQTLQVLPKKQAPTKQESVLERLKSEKKPTMTLTQMN